MWLVVIIRALALHKLPKKTFLALWGIVLCRLLIPFSVPYRFSFYTGIGEDVLAAYPEIVPEEQKLKASQLH